MNQLILKEVTKCCGTRLVVKSSGQFNKRTKGKFICPCGEFRKSITEILSNKLS